MTTYYLSYTEGGEQKKSHPTSPNGVPVQVNLDYLASIGATDVKIIWEDGKVQTPDEFRSDK